MIAADAPKEASEELDNEEEPEPHYPDYDTKVETYDTTVREAVHKTLSLNDQQVIKLQTNL